MIHHKSDGFEQPTVHTLYAQRRMQMRKATGGSEGNTPQLLPRQGVLTEVIGESATAAVKEYQTPPLWTQTARTYGINEVEYRK